MKNYRLKNYLSILGAFTSVLVSSQYQRPIPPPNNNVQSSSLMAGAFIDVNTPTYPQSSLSISDLVKNVLIAGGGGCTTPNVSNVTISPNVAATSAARSWGYFNKGTTAFPFNDGLVLVTGTAASAGNSYQSTTLSGPLTTGSDPDLVSAIPPATSSGVYSDSVILEFDFVPLSSQIKFNYIFASEEYTNSFPCSYSDGFVLLLKPNTPGATYTNMAILPGNAGPVSATNIHPATSFSGSTLSCGATNAQYFGGYNTANLQTNFNGRTIPLTAQATVVPGQSYHFKMVIADYGTFGTDRSYDSAVFIEGGSFNIGVSLSGPGGVALPANLVMCDNTPQTLVAQVDPVPGITFQWSLNGTPITGATANTYTATQPGTYTVSVTLPGNSCPGTASVVISEGHFPVVQDASLAACYTTGNAVFNLTQAQPQLTSTPGATFQYYLTQADADVGNANTIPTPTAFSSAGQTVYVRIKNGTCAKVAKLNLYIDNKKSISISGIPAVINCTTPTATLHAVVASINSTSPPPTSLATVTYNWTASNGGHIVSGGTTTDPVVDAAGTYTLTVTDTFGNVTCTTSQNFSLLSDFTPPPISVSAAKTSICLGESLLLTATGAVTYSWAGLMGNTDHQVITPTTAGNHTYTVNGVGANGCSSTTPGSITINVVPAITSNLQGGLICQGDELKLDAGAGPNYTYLWNTGETTQTITANTPGVYTVKISNGVCEKSYSTNVILAEIPKVSAIDFDSNTSTLTVNAAVKDGTLEYSTNGGLSWQDSNIFNNVPKNTPVKIMIRVKTTTCVMVIEYYTFVMQNAISPNNDGVNDVIDLSGVSRYRDFSGTISDRYGKTIFKADQNNTRWDGYFQGKKLPTSTYWYQLHWLDPISSIPVDKNGWILLKNRE